MKTIRRLVQNATNRLARLAAAKPAPRPILPSGLSRNLARILRPQAAYRWLLPQLAAITPQYIEMTLRGAMAGSHVQAWELFDLMEDSWPRLLKNTRELKTGVLNPMRTYEPYRDDDREPSDSAKEKARLVSAALRTMHPDPAADENALDGTIFDILDAWFKGQVVIEVDWENRACGSLGQIIAPRATYWVHPTCYAWNMEGRLGLRLELTPNLNRNLNLNPSLSPGTWQSTTFQPLPSSVAPFPPDKFILATCKAKSGTALGGALLRPLAWWWCAANFSGGYLMKLAEVFGLPFRWATYAATAPQASIDEINDMLQNLGSDGWAAFPENTNLKFIQPTTSAQDAPQCDVLDRADKQCDLLVLGQTLTTDTGGMGKGGGSKALGQVHAGVKEEIVTAAAKYVKGVLETQLFPSIIRLNYGSPSFSSSSSSSSSIDNLEIPCIELRSEKEEDLVQSAQVIATLAQAGAGKVIGLDWIGKKFGIPKPDDGEGTLEAPVEEDVSEDRGKGVPGNETNAARNGHRRYADTPSRPHATPLL